MTTAALEHLESDVSTLRRDRLGYWQGNLLVTPLVTEDMLATFFLRMKSDGLLDRVFHEATASLSWFMRTYMREETCTLACMKEDPMTKNMTLHGLGWIVNKACVGGVFNKAEIGECFVRHTSPRETLRYGQMMIDWAFEKMDLAVLYGIKPDRNIAGWKYAKILGFDLKGPLPYYTTWVGGKNG